MSDLSFAKLIESMKQWFYSLVGASLYSKQSNHGSFITFYCPFQGKPASKDGNETISQRKTKQPIPDFSACKCEFKLYASIKANVTDGKSKIEFSKNVTLTHRHCLRPPNPSHITKWQDIPHEVGCMPFMTSPYIALGGI